ncbi:SAM-dependent methyltransferase [Actinoplanes siamensis]|uniref:Uncharacterized protein n=1 Tax=Actinoplanes siamensis TaxID=1223317 RepID=A0A919N730_9ACTN|nr:hypothetical protein Asi03nite_31060 [Actinoplanes siamensis]
MLDPGHAEAWPATRADFTALFDGLELMEPGVVLVTDWRPNGHVSDVDPAGSASGRCRPQSLSDTTPFLLRLPRDRPRGRP